MYMIIKDKKRDVKIKDMICRNCEYRFRNKGELQVLNCKKYPAGKPYNPVLKKNKCDIYRAE